MKTNLNHLIEKEDEMKKNQSKKVSLTRRRSKCYNYENIGHYVDECRSRKENKP